MLFCIFLARFHQSLQMVMGGQTIDLSHLHWQHMNLNYTSLSKTEAVCVLFPLHIQQTFLFHSCCIYPHSCFLDGSGTRAGSRSQHQLWQGLTTRWVPTVLTMATLDKQSAFISPFQGSALPGGREWNVRYLLTNTAMGSYIWHDWGRQ